MHHNLYDSQLEVLEAMGMDTIWGARDWIAGFHRDDLHALSLALLHAQSSPVIWQSRVAGDPFERDFVKCCAELLIDPHTRGNVAPFEVHPSYFTYRPGQDYLTEKILYFFKEYLTGPERLSGLTVTHGHRERRFVLRDASKEACLCSIPDFHEFENSTRIKAELLRYIYQICEAREHYSFGRRNAIYEAMKYVDALFGSEPLH